MDHVVEVLGHQEAAVRALRVAAGLLQGLEQGFIALHAPCALYRDPRAHGLGKGVGILVGAADGVHRGPLGLVLLLGPILSGQSLHPAVPVGKAALLGQLLLHGVDLQVHLLHFGQQGLVPLKILLLQQLFALIQLLAPLVLQLQQFLIVHARFPPYRNSSSSCRALASRSASSPASSGVWCGPPWPPYRLLLMVPAPGWAGTGNRETS